MACALRLSPSIITRSCLRRSLSASSVARKLPVQGTATFEITVKPGQELEFDKQTHTGQAWDKDDYRNVRFALAEKQINPNFAINLIKQVPALAVEGRTVACDGGGGALGHPKVYLNLDKPGNHACGYCGLRYYRDGQANDGTDHINV